MLRSKRRNRKDERLKTKKLARSQALALERAEMTDEQKNEQRERIRMQRVEQYQKLEEAQRTGVRVVVDLAFAANQTTREQHSILKQLACVYGYLKTCPLDRPLSLHLASCTQDLATICSQHGAMSWKIGRHVEPLEQLYNADELVYLSPDSENVLDRLDPSCVYVVGGIVDRSVRKGETRAKATSHGYRTARLPLQEHFEQFGTRVRTHIMNLDSVIIVLNEVANHGDWGRAFQRAVPPRITRSQKESNKLGDQDHS
ncbi:tRNA (guanine-N(1)-)-methyltransferase [Phytophthora palmivora]|uniref:tRNA (guanine(9)-N(1))-methyltransferase n=1 Tax=Phytophthora palmivora TaxID=4796 RepID=A0A2P4X967_9STRA|nr:tRNA (guanine-N(1)-)-methyltransferase [Phytophthora palmivora]